MKCMSTQPIVAPSKTEDFMPLHGIDHVEFFVGNALQAASFWVKNLGFKEVGYAGLETGVRDRASHVVEQGRIRIVLTGALVPGHAIGDHVAAPRRRREGDRARRAGRGPRLPRGHRPRRARRRGALRRLRRPRHRPARLDRHLRRHDPHLRRPQGLQRPVPAGLRAARRATPATRACSRSTTSSATSSSATWTSGSSTTRTSSGCGRCSTSPTTTSRPSTPR